MLRNAYVTVTNATLNQVYYADSYPHTDRDADGKDDKYEVPIYKVFIEGTDDKNNAVKKEWSALRFMPFWNNPKYPDADYKTRGYVSAGLNSFHKQAITLYKPNYPIHNHPSEYFGAIVLKGSFYIHAGPASIVEQQWGAAGCIEVIGSFNQFRLDIMSVCGSTKPDIAQAMTEIIQYRKLYVEVQNCASPLIKRAGNFITNK